MSAIFLPIYPVHSGNIAAGRKLVEFRKTLFTKPIERIVVYSTAPVKAAIGIAEVNGIIVVPTNELFTTKYEKYRLSGCVQTEKLKEYYKDTPEAVLIVLEGFKPFKKKIPITDLPFKVPQSFRYLTSHEFYFFQKDLK